MKVALKGEHACCHKELPASPAPSTQCCEAFNVPIPEHASAPVAQLHELKPAWIAIADDITPRPIAVVQAYHATGPPDVVLPVRVMLIRCQPAHAPPFSVA